MNLPDWLAAPLPCVNTVMHLVAASTFLCAAETIAARSLLRNDALAGWPQLKRFARISPNGRAMTLLGSILKAPGIIIIHWVWLGAALALPMASSHPWLRPVLVWALFGVQALIHLSHLTITVYGGDRMRLVILGALALRELAPESEPVARMTLFFIASNCTLAYFVAGYYRLPLAEWRSGRAMAIILRHPLFGDPPLAEWLTRQAGVTRLLTWAVLVLEVGFPLALLGGAHTIVPALVATLLMHLAIGHLMGLSRFVWAFLAAYPAVIYTSEQVRDWLFH